MLAADDGYKSIWTYLYDLPFTQGYVVAGGIRTRYVQAGPKGAPVLIMLHGLGGSWENCFANLRAHAAHFNTFAIDMLGHGFTDKPDRTLEVSDYVAHLKGFMDEMGIARASFLGVSLGSWVATKLATLHPERVGKVTMVSAWGRPQADTPISDSEREARARGRSSRLEAVVNPTWNAIEKIFEGLVVDPRKRLPDLIALRQAIYRQPAMKQSMANIFAGIDPDAWRRNALTDDEVAKIQSPYLIIAAVDSKDVFLASSYAYSKLIPGAKLIEMKGASHWAQWECVDEFNRVNLEFLRAN
jgi:2-hydroxy-6-oxonona-2,4-dienedioate hydrolase